MRLLVPLLLAALAANAAADARLDEARKDGEIVWYTSMNAADAQAVLKPFLERYPFLQLSLLRATSDRIRNKILGDAAEGRFAWDVVSLRMFDIQAVDRKGLLAAYRSPEAASGFPQGAVDPEGHWASIFVREYVVGYNARLVKPGEAPKSWGDLLAPRWIGRIGLDDGDSEWYAAMLDYFGREKGLEYMRGIARQKPQRLRGHQRLADQLAAGAFDLALVYVGDIERARAAGAPLQWVKTLDPSVASPSQVAISAKARHPAAARLFVDYLLSKEGQEAIRSRNRVPARDDVGTDRPARPMQLHFVDPRLAPKYSSYETEFRRLLDKAR